MTYPPETLYNLIGYILDKMDKFFDSVLFKLDEIEKYKQSYDSEEWYAHNQYLRSNKGKKKIEELKRKAGIIYKKYYEIGEKLKSIL